GWLSDLDRLSALEPLAKDAGFRERWRLVKQANKEKLASWIRETMGEAGRTVDPGSLFDAQCKRIHEYKRQHLNLLHVIALWQRIRNGDDVAPRTFIFAGKAAPSYRAAKLIIRLAHGVASAVAEDPRTRDQIRVVF